MENSKSLMTLQAWQLKTLSSLQFPLLLVFHISCQMLWRVSFLPAVMQADVEEARIPILHKVLINQYRISKGIIRVVAAYGTFQSRQNNYTHLLLWWHALKGWPTNVAYLLQEGRNFEAWEWLAVCVGERGNVHLIFIPQRLPVLYSKGEMK